MKIKTKAFKRTTSILLILVMTLGIFALAGCGGTDDNNGDDAADGETSGWAYIENNGELVVGLDDTFAPMGFRDENNELVGFDIDLANAVGEQLGVKITFRPIDWDAKEMELDRKMLTAFGTVCRLLRKDRKKCHLQINILTTAL